MATLDGKSGCAYLHFKTKNMKIGRVEEPNEAGNENQNLTPIRNVQGEKHFCAQLKLYFR